MVLHVPTEVAALVGLATLEALLVFLAEVGFVGVEQAPRFERSVAGEARQRLRAHFVALHPTGPLFCLLPGTKKCLQSSRRGWLR